MTTAAGVRPDRRRLLRAAGAAGAAAVAAPKPIAITRSNCRGLNSHPRLKTDEVGIERVGVGSDSDLNGYDHMPADQQKALRAGYKASCAFRERLDTDDFDQPQRVFDLTEALIRRGYKDADIEAVLGGNFRRLLGATWV